MEDRIEKARELHCSGCNCCQSVVLAFADVVDMDETKASLVAAPFGRGLSGLREVCGCVSGMAIVGGLMGRSSEVRGMAERFREENGDINCGRLLQSRKKTCNDLVASAASILEKTLLCNR